MRWNFFGLFDGSGHVGEEHQRGLFENENAQQPTMAIGMEEAVVGVLHQQRFFGEEPYFANEMEFFGLFESSGHVGEEHQRGLAAQPPTIAIRKLPDSGSNK